MSGQVSVLTQHNDSFRTGANLRETILNTANVNVNQFGKLFRYRVDGQVYAQPLYAANVSIAGKGTHNVVYIATEHNSVYAFDADDAATAPLWRVNLGPAVYFREVSLDVNLRPEMGITSTPVIDSASRTMYVVTYTSEHYKYVYRLHALDISTGQEKLNGPVVIQGSVRGTGRDSVNADGDVIFDPARHLQRPALLLANGIVYIAFGSHADRHVYHGWIFAYNASTLQQVAIYNTTPNGEQGAIWQSGQGLAVDERGDIYFITGNGTATLDGVNVGTSFGKLRLTGSTLSLVDWFTPANFDYLNVRDLDLGSGGPLYVPGSNRIISGGKEGLLYVLNTSDLGQFAHPLQSFRACVSGHIHGSPVYWNSPGGPVVYLWCEEDYLQAFRLSNGLLSSTRADVSAVKAPDGMPGGILSISANGAAAGSGIVWAAIPYNADSIHQTVAGMLRAFNATDLTRELWNSKQNENRDDVGDFAKFNPPLIVNGKVYLATFSGEVLVYGLLPASPPKSETYAINAGGAAQGAFLADTNFSGGVTAASAFSEGAHVDTKALAYPPPQLVHRTARQGNLTYTIPGLTPARRYAVRLHFTEFQLASPGQRRFNVAINGSRVLTNFDIFAAANGSNKAIDRTFTATADASGIITVQFANGAVGSAQVNGIEIAPGDSSSAVFLSVDTTTQGDWPSRYGSEGHSIVNYATSYPSYAQVAVSGMNLSSWVASTTDVRALKKLAPATDRIASTWSASSNFIIDINLIDARTHKVSLYVLDWDNNSRSENIDIVDAVNGAVLDSQSVTSFVNGKYLSWDLKGHVQIRVATMNDVGNSVISALFFDPESTGVSAGGAQATFLKTDTMSHGNWRGVYGTSGYNVISAAASYPSYAQVSVTGQSSFTWAISTVDVRGLQKPSTPDRIAACWFDETAFSIDLNLTDGRSHTLALYVLDWDQQQRSERVDVIDAASGAVLSSRNVSGFSAGKYLVWNIQGHVKISITNTGPFNAVLGGIFFDGGVAGAQASFVTTDTTTQGNWKSGYGLGGYSVINESSYYPAAVQVSASGYSPFTWSSSTSDVRGLQKGGSGSVDRIAACWFADSRFTVFINLDDGQTHKLALYFLDWDRNERAQNIDVLDPTTGSVLDSRSITSFSGGKYLVWNVKGSLQIDISSTSDVNAVLSGIFLDGAAGASAAGPQVSFVTRDITTKGNWKGFYGKAGYNVIQAAASYPAYAQVSATGQMPFTWTSSTTDTRALQKPAAGATDRIAACWFTQTSFTIDLNLTDGNAHQIALYVVDWDLNDRTDNVEILDGGTGAFLDGQAVSEVSTGLYLVWKISGHVKIRITSLASSNAVVSGIFFD